MEDTIILPSPNWFQVSGFAVAPDGWIAYGGPNKSLCILEPLDQNCQGLIQSTERFKAHIVSRSHFEKVTCVDISPEWPEKRCLLTGSVDGIVKQWNVQYLNNKVTIKSTHHHDTHQNEKEEIVGANYSSQSVVVSVGNFGSIVRWDLSTNIASNFGILLRNFKPTCLACSKFIHLMVAVGTKQGVVFVLDLNGKGKIIYKIRAHDDDIFNVSWCPQYEVVVKKVLSVRERKSNIAKRLERQAKSEELEVDPNKSATSKSLPDDSFDETIVEEDSTFDIYKDHEEDEFGHKKYVPEDREEVSEEEENITDNFLAECLKLKEDILKKKQEESSIANLVEALDKTHMDGESSTLETPVTNDKKTDDVYSINIHRHMLASIGKLGAVKIWSKTGKQAGACFVQNTGNNRNQKQKVPYSSTILWYKPDVLLIADGRGYLLECNPLKLNSGNKFQWTTVHALHKRGLYCIGTNAPRVQTPDQAPADHWKVYTVAQDRNIVSYSMERMEPIAVHNTAGGFLYNLQSCPYDATKVALGVGDGAVRVWQSELRAEDESMFCQGEVATFWQNVQGKVLAVAWHPTRENLLAFSTAESRVGIIDTNGKCERPAKTLPTVLRGGIYSLYWGERYDLYACGGGEVVIYKTDRRDKEPEPVKVEIEGVNWKLTALSWHSRGIFFGNDTGAVALFTHQHELVTHAFPFIKMIYKIEWHPQQTSNSFDESPYKDLIAVSSLDKNSSVVILKYTDQEDGPKLITWKVLKGHKNVVLEVTWNPHKDELLLSTSQDHTVRVWDVVQGTCIAIFGNHALSSLGATWSAFPQLPSTVFSGGGDCSVRLWNYEDFPAEVYTEIKHDIVSLKEKKKPIIVEETKKTVIKAEEVKKSCPRRFLLPNLHRQLAFSLKIIEKMLVNMYGKKKLGIDDTREEEKEALEDDFWEIDFTKLFGNTNEVNELLDMEMKRHLEHGRHESWFMLCIFRGHIDTMIQFASERDLLCPFLVSMAPCVSFKYWKDVTQLFITQIERLDAKNEADQTFDTKYYGGVILRKTALYLSVHDVTRAVNTLTDGRMFKEAYVLARARHMDSIAKDILQRWAMESRYCGNLAVAVICYLGLGEVNNAVITLVKSNEEKQLLLAGKLAKASGQKSFATHIREKTSQFQTKLSEEDLKTLPSKIDSIKELGGNGDRPINGDNGDESNLNGASEQ